MTRLNRGLFWGFWSALTLLWLVFNTGVFSVSGLFPLRTEMVQLSGVLAMGAMSVAMVLSLRPRWFETRIGGLDKAYRLHKWLGIGALVLAVAHWLWVNAPKWAIGFGLAARPQRGGGAGSGPPAAEGVEAVLRGLRHTAEGWGEWAFYATVVLLVVALVKLIPYRVFRLTHRLMPVVYLVLVFHTVVLLDYAMWATPLGWLMAAMMAGGSWAALVSLVGRIGAHRRVRGEIVALKPYPGVRSLEAVIALGTGWPGHKAGQFAFVTSNRREGAHPYTMASEWDIDSREITFVAKELGDYTSTLGQTLKVGQEVVVEGPYGRFTFDEGVAGAAPRQIWIGGGIGATPFLARMKELAANPGRARVPVDFFHTTREVDEEGLARMQTEAEAAGIRLHILIDDRDGFLTAERIRETVPDWRAASLWFCGPAGFGKALRADFAAAGLPVERRFHQELFEMR